MSELIKPPEQAVEPPEGAVPSEQRAVMETKVATAEPAEPTTKPERPPGGDNASLKDNVANRQYSDAIEADAKVARAGTDQPLPEVSGFDKSGVMTNEDVRNYLRDTLPPEHTGSDQITEIRYPDRFYPEGDGIVLGECATDTTTGTSQIDIYNQGEAGSYDRDKMEYTLTHEVGHNAYWNLSPEQRVAWDKLSQAGPADSYVSDYARTDLKEDFAESYASYVRDAELLQDVSGDKYAFMRDVVFHGREYGR